MTLTLPTQRDPIARMALFALIGVALYLAAYAAPQPAQVEAKANPVIAFQTVVATPTLAPIEPTAAPAEAAAPPTMAPVALAEPTAEPAPVADAPPADPAAYLANVGDQAPHSPRGSDRNEVQILPTAAPPPSEVDPNAQAAPLPTLAPAQAAVIGARQANGCAPGQVFVPRSGCHTPGSAGPQPGAVRP